MLVAFVVLMTAILCSTCIFITVWESVLLRKERHSAVEEARQ
jgi:hypothetical protein